MYRARILIITLFVGLLAAACGSDAEALSKPEFIAQANAICQASQDEADPIFDAIWAEFDEDTDFDDPAVQDVIFVRFDEVIDDVKPIFDRQLDEIRALEPPSEDKQLIEELLDDQEAALDEFAQLMEAAAAGDEQARATIDGEADPFDDIDRRARAYGLTVCGSQDG